MSLDTGSCTVRCRSLAGMSASSGGLSVIEALILGVVEGVTEYLPVSSTGHLLVLGELLGIGDGAEAALDTFSIAIQFGAILAVLLLYRSRVGSVARGVVGRDAAGRDIAARVLAAFLPAAVVGLLAGDRLKDALFGPVPVAIAWALGGVFLLIWKPRTGTVDLEHMTIRMAALVGVAQVAALWPGVSRSLVTLVAALAIGLSLSAAVEFSFILGVVTLSAATALDLVRNGQEMIDAFGVAVPLVGLATAFVTAILAIRWMVTWLETRSLRLFGWWRLGAAATASVLLATGVL
ncbi:MAG: Undecaprenyl-diphosphatase [Actinomycetota bacterium]